MINFGRKNRLKRVEDHNKREEEFDFESISLYFHHIKKEGVRQVISNETLRDLDLEEVFMSLDNTRSRPGQQYLYYLLRVIKSDPTYLDSMEARIDSFQHKPDIKSSAIRELSKLNSPSAYYLQRLFFGKPMERPHWYFLIPIFSFMALISIFSTFFYPKAFLLFLTFGVLNLVIHFWNKSNIMDYSNTVPQLLKLYRAMNNLLKMGAIEDTGGKLKRAASSLQGLRFRSLILKWESNFSDELTQLFTFLIDLVKGIFLIEPMIFFQLIRSIDSRKKAIKLIFDSISELDVALSVSRWRESLPYYCRPEFTDESRTWEASELYHPLITHPVANNIVIDSNHSLLLSGSNMSGKTTFIRAVGINTILAQTLNTACAKKLHLSRFKLFTAIRIEDDLMEDVSYYFQEVKTIKKLIEESDSGTRNLFLLDELFKGTNTVERIGSGKAVLSFLQSQLNLVICSTHDLELIELLDGEYKFFHFSDKVESGQLIFDYKLREGPLVNTNAIRILEINDFPEEITREAKLLARRLLESKSKEGRT